MFRDASERPVAPALAKVGDDREALAATLVPALWLRGRLTPWLRLPAAGLDIYQWIGLAIALSLAGVATWLGLRALERAACGGLRRGGFELDRAMVGSRLKPLAFQVGLGCVYQQLRLLDLPSAMVGVTIPAVK